MSTTNPQPAITLRLEEAARAFDELTCALTGMIESLYWPGDSGARADRGDPCGDTTPLPPGSVT